MERNLAEERALEDAWFRQHHAQVLTATRLLTRVEGQLDGALTTAQASPGGKARYVLKYELANGLLEQLNDIRHECLDDVEVEATPRLAHLLAMLIVIVGTVATPAASMSDEGDAPVQAAHTMFRDTAAAFQDLVRDCVTSLAQS